MGGYRGDTYYLASASLPDHLPSDFLVTEKDASQVDSHQIVEVLRRGLQERLDLGDPGVATITSGLPSLSVTRRTIPSTSPGSEMSATTAAHAPAGANELLSHAL